MPAGADTVRIYSNSLRLQVGLRRSSRLALAPNRPRRTRISSVNRPRIVGGYNRFSGPSVHTVKPQLLSCFFSIGIKESAMKLDLLFELQPRPRPWKKPHPYGQREAEINIINEALEQTKLADKVGFNTVWCVEHHFKTTRSACSASECVLAAMAMITERIRIGFGVTLVPFNFINPVRVAEKVAMVDILSKGRVEWGTGRSTPIEQTAFHVPTDARSRDQIIEAIKIISGMWEKEYFSHHSEHYDLPERYITPRPFQDPHPPVWMASGSKDSSVHAGHGG